jgi:two-component system chemotaxis response regulator CheY
MKNVVIVDDSKTIQRVIEQQLSKHFSVIGKGSSGIEGFELYKKLKPDFILLDIIMPNCSGKECLKLIIEFDPKAIVIMVSSIGDDTTIKECLALGAKSFIKKDNFSKTSDSEQPFLEAVLRILNEVKTSGAA